MKKSIHNITNPVPNTKSLYNTDKNNVYTPTSLNSYLNNIQIVNNTFSTDITSINNSQNIQNNISPAILDNYLSLAGGELIGGLIIQNDGLQVTGQTTLNNDLTVIGSTTLNNGLDVTGTTTLNNGLDVTGNTFLNNDLTVSGQTNLLGGISVTGQLNMNNNKIVNLADPTNNQDASTKYYVDSSTHYTGDFKTSFQTTNHGPWLLCDGSTVSRTTYATLFSLIGVTFGVGDGFTTFTLPDGRNRVPGISGGSHPVGQYIGNDNHTLTTAEMPSHTHSFTGSVSGSATVVVPGQGGYSDYYIGDPVPTRLAPSNVTEDFFTVNASGPISGTATGTTGSNGTGGSFSLLQPTIFIGNLFIHI